MRKSWELDYKNPELMVSLQQLMLDKKGKLGIDFLQLGNGEGKTARNYLSPGYLAKMVPLSTSTIASLHQLLNELSISQRDIDTFHEQRVSESSQQSTNQQSQNSFSQNISFSGCDFQNANVISGNQQVSITVKK